MLQFVEIVASAFSEGKSLTLSSKHRLLKPANATPSVERTPTPCPPKLSKGLFWPASFALWQRLANDTVCVFASASGPAHLVVASLGQLDAAGGWQVAEQAREHQGEGTHEGPAGTAV